MEEKEAINLRFVKDMSIIRGNIKSLMRKNGLNKRDLANKAGITLTRMTRLLTGSSVMWISDLANIAWALGTDCYSLHISFVQDKITLYPCYGNIILRYFLAGNFPLHRISYSYNLNIENDLQSQLQ